MNLSSRFKTITAAALLALSCAASSARPAQAQQQPHHPAWLDSAVIYCIYPEVFSHSGFDGVTAQLPRLKSLGVKVIWLMPETPVGHPYHGHEAIDSPYAVHDYYALNPQYGTPQDFRALVNTAHSLGLKVILDEVLNHTAWDNPLTHTHPEFYYHSDSNPRNVASEQMAFTYADVVQLDYSNPKLDLWSYMDKMLAYWIKTYNVDGFRFDAVDNPYGPSRKIPKAFFQQLRPVLEAAKPSVLMLGEEEDPDLALAPYELDYGWHMQSALSKAAFTGNNAGGLKDAWDYQNTSYPPAMLHMNIMQDWDINNDLQTFGGVPNTLAAAVFNYTSNGVPLLFNGEEVGNDNSILNTHAPIHWSNPNAARFTSFYKQLIALRNSSPALQQGTFSWETNASPTQVVTYDRMGGPDEFYVEVNFSGAALTGTCSVPSGKDWTDVTPGGLRHTLPSTGNFALAAYDYAVFKRAASLPDAPSGLSAIPGNNKITLSWPASGSVTGYSVYRGGAAGGEDAKPIATGVTGTTYVDTNVTNGTPYYYKVEAVNSLGASPKSVEATVSPTSAPISIVTGSLTPFTSTTTFNLTALGAADWAAYGDNGGYDHKATGSQISNVSAAGGSLNSFTNDTIGLTWTNGAPDASATAEQKGYYNSGSGNGFSLTVPASTTPQTLTLYVGGYDSSATLTAGISGASSIAYTDTGLSGPGTSYYGAYTLTFSAVTAGQTLTVTWKETSGSGNVTIYGAALY